MTALIGDLAFALGVFVVLGCIVIEGIKQC